MDYKLFWLCTAVPSISSVLYILHHFVSFFVPLYILLSPTILMNPLTTYSSIISILFASGPPIRRERRPPRLVGEGNQGQVPGEGQVHHLPVRKLHGQGSQHECKGRSGLAAAVGLSYIGNLYILETKFLKIT